MTAPRNDPPPFTRETRDQVEVITLGRDTFDEARCLALQDALRGIVASTQPSPSIVLCCQNLRYASSRLLGVMMDIALKATRGNGRMRIAAMTPAVLDLYQLTRMDRIVPHHPTLEAALASLRSPPT